RMSCPARDLRLPLSAARAARFAGVSRPARRLPDDAARDRRAPAGAPGTALSPVCGILGLGAAPAPGGARARRLVRAAGERGPAVPQGHRRPVERASRGGARRARRPRKCRTSGTISWWLAPLRGGAVAPQRILCL